jgi:hypothetical protein
MPQTSAPDSPARPLGIQLTWWATDTLSGATSFDVQAREMVHSSIIYTLSTEMREVTQLNYELAYSGTEPITNTYVTTATLPYTTVAPLRIFTPVQDPQWITVSTGVATTQTAFIGNPGSIYDFRVRARDAAGNEQDWYDGYSAQARADLKQNMISVYIPLLLR